MVAQIANNEAGSSVRIKLNTILAGDAARRVWGVRLTESSPFEAVWLTEAELRDIIGLFGTNARGLVPDPGTPTGSRVLYDTGWGEASASIVDAEDDATAYPTGSPYIVTSVFNQHRFFTNAVDHFVQFPSGLSVNPAAHGRLTAPPLNTLSIRAVTGVTISGQAGNGLDTLWTVPAAGTVEWVVYANNTVEMYGDSTFELALNGPLYANGFEIYGVYSPFQSTSGAQDTASSGRSWSLTGNVTAVRIVNGWWGYYRASGGSRTITPGSGTCVKSDGTTQATVTLGSGMRCIVRGDGTNLLVDGDVT